MPLTAEQRRHKRAQNRHKTLTCSRCGGAFTAVRKTALYCSPTCRQPSYPVGVRTPAGKPIRKARRADKLVRNYLRRHLPLPDTLAELLRAIGLTPADARLLRQAYGPHYWGARMAQAWPKAFPSGQARPAVISTWNNLSNVLGRSLNLTSDNGRERVVFQALKSATSQREIAAAVNKTARRIASKAG
jgi:hypothetical protein